MSDLRRRLFNEFAGEHTNPFEKAPEIIDLSSIPTFLETPTCINGTYFALSSSTQQGIYKSNDLYNWVGTSTTIPAIPSSYYQYTIGWSAYDSKIWFKKPTNYGLSYIEYNENTGTFGSVVDCNWATEAVGDNAYFLLLDDIHFTDSGELYCLGKYNYQKISTTYTWNNEYNYIIASTNNMTSIIPVSQQGFNDRYPQSGRPDRKGLISPHLLAIGDDRVTALLGQCMIDGTTANSFAWNIVNSSVLSDNTNIVKTAYAYNDIKLDLQGISANWYQDDVLYVMGAHFDGQGIYGGNKYVHQFWKSEDFGDTYTYISNLPNNLYTPSGFNSFTFYNKGVFAWIGTKFSGNYRSYYLYSTTDFDSFSSFNTYKLAQNSSGEYYRLIKETDDSYIMYNAKSKLLYRWYK